MGYENVKLWFARDESGEIVTIDEVNEIHSTYNCPVCGSSLLPKATESKKVTPHFAHIDASKCNTESHVHWWFKNKLIEPGDEFKIVSDKEGTYICKEILVEQQYPTSFGVYRPDVTVITESGETIYFEMAFSNKKKIKDYLDMWLELNNIVVEVNVKDLIRMTVLPSFKSLFHKGKCFNLKKNDHYYNSIGKYKERICSEGISKDIKERLNNLDWFWTEVFNYRKGVRNIDYMTDLIDSVNHKDVEVIEEILSKKSCVGLYRNYLEYKNEKLWNKLKDAVLNQHGENHLKYIKPPYIQHERYFGINSYIEVYHEDERCYYVTNLKYEKLDEIYESILQTMKKNTKIKLINQNLKEYQQKGNTIDEKIAQMIIEKGIFSDMGSCYSVEYRMNHKYINTSRFSLDYDLNSFEAEFKLTYSNYRTASSETIAINEESNIEKLILDIEKSFENFISNVNPLQNIEELNELVEDIEKELKCFNVLLVGSLSLEDEYKIDIDYDSGNFPYCYFSDYYIKNSGLYKDYGRLLMTNDRTLFKTTIIEDIQNQLKDSFRNKCTDCREYFGLNLGESLFYRNKGFDFPKRCKSCRKQKKLERYY